MFAYMEGQKLEVSNKRVAYAGCVREVGVMQSLVSERLLGGLAPSLPWRVG